jgi:hypothetical protein
MSNIINWGRKYPIKFAEHFFGLSLMDYQKLAFMESWAIPYALWLECRGAGKDTLAAVYFMTKMVLIPNYILYVSSNSAAQSAESFMKLEDISMQRIPSFKDATDVFAHEVEKAKANETGFSHSPMGYKFRLYNNSQMVTLSSNIETSRGKRGAVWFNETAWKTAEELAVIENFANVDSSFSTSTHKNRKIDPIQMPLQLLYTSSAGDVSYPFFEKYKTFAKKMILGNRNYYCIDIDAYDILYHTTLDGEKIKSHLSEDQIKKAIEEDPDAADRELFNRFRKGAGQNAVVSMDSLIRNSVVRKPLLYNDTGKRKFILCYDPARNFDGSILGIFELINDPTVGYKLKVAHVISMVDTQTQKKTPLPMPEQLNIIKDVMVNFNGERAAEWENIEFYIDSGSGGGGISAVADQLMENWKDKTGQEHRGVIDPEHKQYEAARKKYLNAMPIIHLLDPQSHKKLIYDALSKMIKLNLIEFTSYENKEYLMLENENKEFETVYLTDEERLSLLQIELMKTEVSYMCRYDTPNGGVSYELAKDKKNVMHDDRAYVLAMAAYALALLRRTDLIRLEKPNVKEFDFKFRQPVLRKI